jgi:hypothetical protein
MNLQHANIEVTYKIQTSIKMFISRMRWIWCIVKWMWKTKLTSVLYKRPIACGILAQQLSQSHTAHFSTPCNTSSPSKLWSAETPIRKRKQVNWKQRIRCNCRIFERWGAHPTFGTRWGFLATYSHSFPILLSFGPSSCGNIDEIKPVLRQNQLLPHVVWSITINGKLQSI